MATAYPVASNLGLFRLCHIHDALKNVGNFLIGHPYTGCSAYMILVCGLLITDYGLRVKEHSQTILFTALLPEILSIVTVIKPCFVPC
jgi:hypothetical protein